MASEITDAMVERAAFAILAEAGQLNSPHVQRDLSERLEFSRMYARRYARAALEAALRDDQNEPRSGI